MQNSGYWRCFLFSLLVSGVFNKSTDAQSKNASEPVYHEPYRPQFHFSPKEHWMNDPNGLIYNEGIYNLFFQYYPGATVWGPMHWGHATSKDLMHWQEQPIALYPDSLGYIFSGSAVLDKNNTSGFAANGRVPIVAIFTYHDPVGEKERKNNFQYQGIAYSLDNGKSWTKYQRNPVLANPASTDFRDPKVMWYEEGKKWIMTLAIKDHIGFFSSPDLKRWKAESEFGNELGAHGGVWECPDLISFDNNGKKTWVLIVNINPGGPNGGSATQYFIGDFNGKQFTTSQKDTRWLDYGPDEYAGVTWSNVGSRKIFFGWMSNWLYGMVVPTEKWRSAMTIPRDLSLRKSGQEIYVASTPTPELKTIQSGTLTWSNIPLIRPFILRTKTETFGAPCRIDASLHAGADFTIVLSNDQNEEAVIGYDKEANQFYIDRTRSGRVDFHKEFAAKHFAPRFSKNVKMNITLVIDVSSIELFADDGLTVMTAIVFPSKPFQQIQFASPGASMVEKLSYSHLENTWK
jgi:fructan beta-fructosidase